MTIVATPSQTAGPLWGFALIFEGSEDAVDPSSPGAIRIEGTLYEGDGEPLVYPDAFLEIWSGDQFARTRTDEAGVFRATVAKPEPVPLPDGRMQAPHLNVAVFARGLLKQAQTRLYFPDEERANEADPVLEHVPPERRHTLIAREEDGVIRFDIRLQGDPETETVFFAF